MSRSIVVLAFFLITASAAFAQAPDSVGFQGYLTRSDGSPLDSSNVSMTFKLYKSGTEIWTETQIVAVDSGYYNVYLGAMTPLDTVAFDRPIDLGITIDGDPPEITPRTPLVASAFALGLRGITTYADSRDDIGLKGTTIVGGDSHNSVSKMAPGATISGGGGTVNGNPVPNVITAHFGTIGGGSSNTVNGPDATIAGGGANLAVAPSSTIGGGSDNVAGGPESTVAGGHDNHAFGFAASVGGGRSNQANADSAAIAGGTHNTADDQAAFVGGGSGNHAGGSHATVGGGYANSASSGVATVGGGDSNTASAVWTTVAGGGFNAVNGESGTVGGGYSNTSGANATVGGGNTNTASGFGATIPGGMVNAARGHTSFAAGWQARANHNGAFVWQDSTGAVNDTLASTASNQFLARASGGFAFYTAAAPDLSTGSTLAPGSGTWGALSSKSSKTAIREIDAQDYLDRVASLRVAEWKYKTEDPSVTHLGPMAEDFFDAFGLGPSNRSITTVDADGVALAAIQGLYQIVKEQQAEIERMRAAMARAGLK